MNRLFFKLPLHILLMLAGWIAGGSLWPTAESQDEGLSTFPGKSETGFPQNVPGFAKPGPGGISGVEAMRLTRFPHPEFSGEENAEGVSEESVSQALADPAAVGRLLREGQKMNAILLMARRLALVSPKALMDFLTAATDERERMIGEAAPWAFCRKPEAGLALLRALPDDSVTASLAETMLLNLLPKDTPATTAWVEKLPDGPLKRAAVKAVLPNLADQDPRRAIRLVAESSWPGWEGNKQRISRLATVFNLSTPAPGSPPLSMEKRLEAFPAADRAALGQELKIRELHQLSQYGREEVAARVEEELSADPSPEWKARLQNVYWNLINHWAETDPQRALEEFDRMPADFRPKEAAGMLFRQLAVYDPVLASARVQALPEGPLKESAVAGLSRGLMIDSPVEALTWAAALKDPEARFNALENVLRNGQSGNAALIRETLDTLSLTPEERAKLPIPPAKP